MEKVGALKDLLIRHCNTSEVHNKHLTIMIRDDEKNTMYKGITVGKKLWDGKMLDINHIIPQWFITFHWAECEMLSTKS